MLHWLRILPELACASCDSTRQRPPRRAPSGRPPRLDLAPGRSTIQPGWSGKRDRSGSIRQVGPGAFFATGTPHVAGIVSGAVSVVVSALLGLLAYVLALVGSMAEQAATDPAGAGR